MYLSLTLSSFTPLLSWLLPASTPQKERTTQGSKQDEQPQLQYYALINMRMVSSSSVTRVSMHTAKRDQKQPCFVEYIRHLHVDLYLVDSQIWGVTVACRSELCNMP